MIRLTTGEIGSDGEVKKFGTLAVVQVSFRGSSDSQSQLDEEGGRKKPIVL